MLTEDSMFVENHKGYVDAYRVFSRHRDKQQQVWVENDLMKRLRDAFTHSNTKTKAPKSEFKILAVGSNDGAFDKLFINALYSHGKELVESKQVTYTVVEPNAVAIDEFQNNASLQGGVFQNIKFNWINKRIEEFLETEEPEQYDLIHFTHVLYYAESEEQVLKSAFDKFLANPGVMIAVVVADWSIWVQLAKAFRGKIPSIVYKVLTNVQLSEICIRNGWKYEAFEGKLNLEVTEVFNQRDPVGQAILKFLLHMNEEPKEKLGKEIMSELIEFFVRISWEELKDGKKHFFVHEDDWILLAHKCS